MSCRSPKGLPRTYVVANVIVKEAVQHVGQPLFIYLYFDSTHHQCPRCTLKNSSNHLIKKHNPTLISLKKLKIAASRLSAGATQPDIDVNSLLLKKIIPS